MNNQDFEYGQDPRTSEESGFQQQAPNAAEDISGVVENLSKPRTMLYSVLSLIMGIVSLVFCCCSGWFGIAFGVLSIAFSVVSRRHLGYFDAMSVIGLVLGIAGLLFALATVILASVMNSGAMDVYLEEFFKELENGGVTPPLNGGTM